MRRSAAVVRAAFVPVRRQLPNRSPTCRLTSAITLPQSPGRGWRTSLTLAYQRESTPVRGHRQSCAASSKHDAYASYVWSFQRPLYYAIYLVGIALLAAHLGHGASSWLQSLGWRHPKYPADKLGPLIAVTLFVGYMVPPTAVLVGVVS